MFSQLSTSTLFRGLPMHWRNVRFCFVERTTRFSQLSSRTSYRGLPMWKSRFSILAMRHNDPFPCFLAFVVEYNISGGIITFHIKLLNIISEKNMNYSYMRIFFVYKFKFTYFSIVLKRFQISALYRYIETVSMEATRVQLSVVQLQLHNYWMRRI